MRAEPGGRSAAVKGSWMLTYLLLAAGFVLLVAGADRLVAGAQAIARALGVSDLLVGLTVVAFGTSAPELIVNLFAAIENRPEIAVGNVLGSNIFNILVILGASAALRSLAVGESTVWKEIPLSLLAALMVGILGNDVLLDRAPANVLTRIDGLVLLSFFGLFLYYVVGLARVQAKASAPPQDRPSRRRWALAIIWVVLGLAALNVGAKWVVDGAVKLAAAVGVSERIIGLTIVAAGTSLPELATSLAAALKRNADIAVGNVVGSNIFNVFAILGASAVIRPLPLALQANLDVAAAVAASGLLFVTMFTGRPRHACQRWEGIVYLGVYMGYIACLALIR